MSLPTPSLFHSCNIFRSISCFCFIPPFSRLSLPLSWIVFWLLSFFSHSICIWHCAATVIVATFIIELFCCKVRLYAGFLQYWPSTSFLFIWRSTTASSFLHFPLSSRLSSRKTNAGLIHLSRFNIRSIVLSLPLSHYLSLSLSLTLSLSLSLTLSLSLSFWVKMDWLEKIKKWLVFASPQLRLIRENGWMDGCGYSSVCPSISGGRHSRTPLLLLLLLLLFLLEPLFRLLLCFSRLFSVTRWLDLFSTFGHLQQWKFTQYRQQFAKVCLKFFPNTKWTLKMPFF